MEGKSGFPFASFRLASQFFVDARMIQPGETMPTSASSTSETARRIAASAAAGVAATGAADQFAGSIQCRSPFGVSALPSPRRNARSSRSAMTFRRSSRTSCAIATPEWRRSELPMGTMPKSFLKLWSILSKLGWLGAMAAFSAA